MPAMPEEHVVFQVGVVSWSQSYTSCTQPTIYANIMAALDFIASVANTTLCMV